MALPPQKPRPSVNGVAPKPPAEDAIAKARREKDALEGECQKLEEELEALRARYEQYFLGIERKEPVRQREELKKRVLRLKEAFTRNTGLKFRIQALYARYLSYERLWLRTAREKEEGTYRRDLFKARLRASHGAAIPPPQGKAAAEEEAGKGEAAPPVAEGAAAGARSAGPREAAAPPKAPPLPSGVTEAQLRTLYAEYLAAKRRCNEDVTRVSYEAMARSLAKQIPELMARHRAKGVELRVDVKDGRAVVRAIPKA